MSEWAWNVILAADQLLNAVFGGHHKETVSERAARQQLEGRRWACIACRLLDRLAKNHCRDQLVRRYKI